MADDTLARVGNAAAGALLGMVEPIASTEGAVAFLAELGWDVPAAFGGLGVDPADVDDVVDAFIDVVESRDAGADESTMALKYVQLLAAVAVLAEDLANLRTSVVGLDAAFLAASGFAQELARRAADYLIVEFTHTTSEPTYWALVIAGVYELQPYPVDAATFQSEHVRRVVHYDRLKKLVTDPLGLFTEVYGWGSVDAKLHLLLERSIELAHSLDLPAYFVYPSVAKEAAVKAPAVVPTDGEATDPDLRLPVYSVDLDGIHAEIGFALGTISDPVGSPPGLSVSPFLSGSATTDVALNKAGTWLLRLAADLDLTLGLAAVLRPAQPLKLVADFTGGGTEVTGSVAAEIRRESGGDAPVPLITIGSSGVFVRGLHAKVGLGIADGKGEIFAEAAVEEAKAGLSLGGGDSFVAKALPGELNEISFSLGARWSSRTGVSLMNGSGLEVAIGASLTLGPITLRTIYIGLGFADTGVTLQLAVAAGVVLGPVAATVDRVGMRFTLKKKTGGNLGPFDLVTEFQPPKGLGLVVDATVVKGGGYLYFDPDKGEYAGVLELSIKDQLQIKAIGLLTTKLPDGKPGFSLLLIITAQFSPIQLGLGFTLTGIGGLAGINRTMLVEVLRAGLKSHTLGSIMFPENPVKNATKIISDLRSIFPPAEGRYVFGPMLELNWGTPALITAEIGVFIELPAPINLAILGIIKAMLPEPTAPVVKIHMDVIGTIEFEKKRLAIDAMIYDSEIVGLALTGDMAMRLLWGDRPNFALSVGGLNPRFAPPPEFPTLRRLQLSMGKGSNPRLSLDTYFAITSNSVQVGAHLDIRAEGGGFVLHGYLGFDALFIFSPFSFIAEMAGGVDLMKGSSVLMSIHLDFTLSGPAPWHAFGHASIKILFFKVSVGFDAQWGEPAPAALEPADAKAPLLAALSEAGNWSATLPTETERGASLAEARAPQGLLLVHPLGRLQVQQKVVPLGETITRFGSAAPDKWNHFSISAISLNGNSAPHEDVKDFFARGQFFELSDEDKLSKASFDKLNAGLTIGSDNIIKGAESKVDVHYETYLVDDPILPSRAAGRYRLNADLFLAQLRVGAGSLSPVRMSAELKFSEPGAEGKIRLGDLAHVIVTTDELSVRGDLLDGEGASQVSAENRLERHLAKHPEDRGRLQVMPKHELAA
jgi:hypothetical protein